MKLKQNKHTIIQFCFDSINFFFNCFPSYNMQNLESNIPSNDGLKKNEYNKKNSNVWKL